MAGFRDLADRLGELAQIPSRITAPVATAINAELHRQFEDGVDPYGRPWAKLADSTVARKGHDTILVDDGALATETRALPMGGAGIELVSNEVGGYHQSGTSRMPRRPILPDGSSLPKAWQAAIAEEYAAAFRKVMK